MKNWKLWIIATSDEGGVSSHILDFSSLDEAEEAHQAVHDADLEETYAQLEAVRLYEKPLEPGWDK